MNEIKVTSKDDVIKAVKDNHIWLNATNCINPTPEFCEELGRTIINKLNQKDKLIPSFVASSDGEEVHPASLELASMTKMLYLSVNKS